ncbi:hypothetical protein THRCLA_00482 [Thraustotheca clavata]|uniref:Uncharacterized protein n=1 Tax=Thraustotheca clavata TaxID=74557 RepID=A0A1W0ABE8_9STRA|nr:hypothetical protein THRCLA_00482 [Thraustotheca clavata]
MQFTPQQLVGAGRYSATTRIGNWNEDLMLEEARMKDYRLQKQKGGLGTAHRQKMEQANVRVPQSFYEDGFLLFNSYIVLEHMQTGGCLSCDVWEETFSGSGEFIVSVGKIPNVPTARSTFCIVSPTGQTGLVRYGDPFRLMANEALRVDGNTLLPMLFLKSNLKNERSMSPISSNQNVTLSVACDNSTLWVATRADVGGAEKLLATSTPISTDDGIGIMHKMTGQLLFADAKNAFVTDFGNETEVCCLTVKGHGKCFNLAHEAKGARTSDMHARSTLSQNAWRLNLATTPDNSVDNRRLPAPSTTESVACLLVHALAMQNIFGLRQLVQSLQVVDSSSGTGLMDREDLKWAIKACESESSISLRDDQFEVLLNAFDDGKKGFIRISRFVDLLRGPLSDTRKNMINQTYDAVSASIGNLLTLEALSRAYDSGCESAFKQTRSVDFMKLWSTQDLRGTISRNEFLDVYKDISRTDRMNPRGDGGYGYAGYNQQPVRPVHGNHAPQYQHNSAQAPPYYPPPPHVQPMHPMQHFDGHNPQMGYHDYMRGPPRGMHHPQQPPLPNTQMMYQTPLPPHQHHGPPGMFQPPLPPQNSRYLPPRPGFPQHPPRMYPGVAFAGQAAIPPANYVCRKCNTAGHWIQDCQQKGGYTQGNRNTSKAANTTENVQPAMQFHCEPCDKHFPYKSQYDAHLNTHESCWEPNCDFSACKRVVTSHHQTVHGQFAGSGLKEIDVEGQKFTVLVGNSPEDIAKWREERRKKWPSTSVVKRKMEENEERIRAGDVVEPALKRVKTTDENSTQVDPKESHGQVENDVATNASQVKNSPDKRTNKKSTKFCVKYIRNECKLGDECHFNHNISHVNCKSFSTKGTCRRGDNCKFMHSSGSKKAPKAPTKSATTQVKEHKNSLLGKLLEKDIIREQRLVLQAFRFIVEKNFFDQPSN